MPRLPTPDDAAPQLDGADERAILAAWIAWQAGGWAVLNYPRWRRGYEAETLQSLPARVPARLGWLLGRR